MLFRALWMREKTHLFNSQEVRRPFRTSCARACAISGANFPFYTTRSLLFILLLCSLGRGRGHQDRIGIKGIDMVHRKA